MEEEEDPPGLLSLPPDLLALLVSSVEGKSALRRTCHTLHLAVDDCATWLEWRDAGRRRSALVSLPPPTRPTPTPYPLHL